MTLREGLLSLLHDGPRHGYQLKTQFEAVTGGVWPLNVGQVYTTLDRLERDGLVRILDGAAAAPNPGGPGQKVYEITAPGIAALGEWWQAVPADEPPPRDELMLKVLMAIDHGPAHALAVITHQRTVLLSVLQAKRREHVAASKDGGISPSLSARLVTDALMTRAEADLRWLDTCETALSKEDQ